MHRISRRRFLATGAMLAATPWIGRALASSHPDVVVVGAGAAGLAASMTLAKAGVRVTTIEASSRIGGRALTDTRLFGVPYDVGAHWLHYAGHNPFVKYAQQNGFTVYPAPDRQVIYIGGRKASAAENTAFDKAYQATIAAISRAGRAGKDVSAASVAPDTGAWRDLAAFVIGPWDMGKDLDDFSCLDWWNSDEGPDWFCKEGFGALLAHHARGVPVALSTPAHRIRWGGKGVRVETARGDIVARACIVTVSTGLLSAERVQFDPPLSPARQAAFHAIDMGLYNHIALQFRENVLGLGPDEYLLYRPEPADGRAPRMMGTLANVSGTNLSVADVGGDFARELEGLGSEASLDFALSELRKIFGSSMDKHFIKGHATAWGSNPLTLGSYASARPGAFEQRAVLRRAVGDRIWFAGEACSRDQWATLAGAYKSGQEVAREVLRRLRQPA